MTNKTRLIALALSLLCITSGSAQKRINVNNLPKPAQTFLTKHFDNVKVLRVEKDTDDGKTAYEVNLKGNIEVDFDNKGNWEEVSGMVPAAIIPAQITKSVKNDYNDKRIVKIERERNGGYEIELANGLDITYDKNFKVVKVDK